MKEIEQLSKYGKVRTCKVVKEQVVTYRCYTMWRTFITKAQYEAPKLN